jgi:hypothetical protein
LLERWYAEEEDIARRGGWKLVYASGAGTVVVFNEFGPSSNESVDPWVRMLRFVAGSGNLRKRI